MDKITFKARERELLHQFMLFGLFSAILLKYSYSAQTSPQGFNSERNTYSKLQTTFTDTDFLVALNSALDFKKYQFPN